MFDCIELASASVIEGLTNLTRFVILTVCCKSEIDVNKGNYGKKPQAFG
jgi:hypothetical protein